MIGPEAVVYLSGPMTGYPEENRPAFLAAEYLLRMAYGCAVLNPARWPAGLTWVEYLRLDVAMLRRASAVVLLPGWESSRGARIEADLAAMGGIAVVELAALAPARRAA